MEERNPQEQPKTLVERLQAYSSLPYLLIFVGGILSLLCMLGFALIAMLQASGLL